jgi:hypothetical protein
MKKALLTVTVFLTGFLIGAITINLLTIPARAAYREMLQTSYIYKQHHEAKIALKEGRQIDAYIHLRNQLDAGAIDGSNLFEAEMQKEIDQTFWFMLLPSMKNYLNKIINVTPGSEPKVDGMLHCKIASALESLELTAEADKHWQLASNLLNLDKETVKEKFLPKNNNAKTIDTGHKNPS